MILISHRGNLSGPNPDLENSQNYINTALSQGFDVEIDVWMVDGKFYMGHDTPQYETQVDFIKQERLWLHIKNIEMLQWIVTSSFGNFFWHQNDDYTLTSKNFIWAYPDVPVPHQDTKSAIAVLPSDNFNINNFAGVCSDHIIKYA
mgnify:CR=1 FL=1